MSSPAIEAPAKINLFLDLLRKRADGYHDLSTLFAEVSLADRLELHDAAQLALEVDGPFAAGVPTDERNLVWRAVERLYQETRTASRHRIRLTKNIPHGAGLGGGSADAAAALVLVNQSLPEPRLSPGRLEGLAAELGSDCAFFVRTGPALGTDRGTMLEPVKLSRTIPCLLVLPDFPISTREAYARIAPGMLGTRSDVAAWKSWLAAPSANPPAGANTFEDALLPVYPELALILSELTAAGATYARLSGSGSACFGLFASNAARDRAATKVGEHRQVVACQVLPRHVPRPGEVGRVSRSGWPLGGTTV